MKTWDELTEVEQKAFYAKNADEIFACNTHGVKYEVLCEDCRAISTMRYGVFEIE